MPRLGQRSPHAKRHLWAAAWMLRKQGVSIKHIARMQNVSIGVARTRVLKGKEEAGMVRCPGCGGKGWVHRTNV